MHASPEAQLLSEVQLPEQVPPVTQTAPELRCVSPGKHVLDESRQRLEGHDELQPEQGTQLSGIVVVVVVIVVVVGEQLRPLPGAGQASQQLVHGVPTVPCCAVQ
jgi:hypothetical protein